MNTNSMHADINASIERIKKDVLAQAGYTYVPTAPVFKEEEAPVTFLELKTAEFNHAKLHGLDSLNRIIGYFNVENSAELSEAVRPTLFNMLNA